MRLGRKVLGLALLLAGAAFPTLAQSRRVAITIDDSPRGGDGPRTYEAVRSITERLLEPFRKDRIPVIGFVNEGSGELTPDQLREVLAMWLDAGGELGNHTYSHRDLNRLTLAEFEADLLKGEVTTKAVMQAKGKRLRYFRHPFLHVGLDVEKRRASEQVLRKHGYTIAPITLDNSDYLFAVAYTRALKAGNNTLAERIYGAYVPYLESIFEFFERRSVEVTGHEVAQTLLLHVNELNARAMPELLAMMRERGYRFVTLEEALKDPAYSLPDNYAGSGGFSWIHHWSITKGMPGKGEPDEPAWIRQAASGQADPPAPK